MTLYSSQSFFILGSLSAFLSVVVSDLLTETMFGVQETDAFLGGRRLGDVSKVYRLNDVDSVAGPGVLGRDLNPSPGVVSYMTPS